MRAREILESPPALNEKIRYAGISGWLALLVFYLLLLQPTGTIIAVIAGYRFQLAAESAREGTLLSNIVSWLVALLLAGMGIYAGVALLKKSPGAVVLTKRFFIACFVGGVVISAIRYGSSGDLAALNVPILPVIWYVYLVLSRRVANTFPRSAGSGILGSSSVSG